MYLGRLEIHPSSYSLKKDHGYRNILRCDRICKKCTTHSVGDETHFLISCPAFQYHRSCLFDFITTICPNFIMLDDVKNIFG